MKARTLRDTTAILANVPKEQRNALTTQQNLKLRTKCEEGLPEPHFDFLPQGTLPNLDSLKNLYSVHMKVAELKQWLTAGDVHAIFTASSLMYNNPELVYNKVPAAGSSLLKMSTSIQELDFDLVKNWNECLTLAEEKYLVENLLWSGTKIKASLSEKLREKLIEKTMGWPIAYQTGLINFKCNQLLLALALVTIIGVTCNCSLNRFIIIIVGCLWCISGRIIV